MEDSSEQDNKPSRSTNLNKVVLNGLIVSFYANCVPSPFGETKTPCCSSGNLSSCSHRITYKIHFNLIIPIFPSVLQITVYRNVYTKIMHLFLVSLIRARPITVTARSNIQLFPSLSRTLGSWVRIPLKACMFAFILCWYCSM
jgi:hypothetical protein